jgi:hypothetical protein
MLDPIATRWIVPTQSFTAPKTCCRVIGRQLSRQTRPMRSEGLVILEPAPKTLVMGGSSSVEVLLATETCTQAVHH